MEQGVWQVKRHLTGRLQGADQHDYDQTILCFRAEADALDMCVSAGCSPAGRACWES